MKQPVFKTYSLRRAAGFTLVELMIALVLGLIVVGGALAVFVSQRVTANLSSQQTDVLAEGRLALDALARDLRAAGDFGCWPVTNPIDERLNSKSALDADAGGLIGFDDVGSVPADSSSAYGLAKLKTALLAATPAGFASESSILGVTGIFGSLSSLTTAMAAQSSDLVVKKPVETFKANDVAVITDCINWAKFQVTEVVPGTETQTLKHAAGENASYAKGNLSAELGEIFGVGATVGRLDSVWWFVGQVDGRAGLYRLSARDNIPVLVSSRVHAIDIVYDQGQDATGKITDAGRTAAQVAASTEKWTSVRSATISMLLRSDKVGNAGQQTLSSFAGRTITNDGHVYLPLQMTVALRNQ